MFAAVRAAGRCVGAAVASTKGVRASCAPALRQVGATRAWRGPTPPALLHTAARAGGGGGGVWAPRASPAVSRRTLSAEAAAAAVPEERPVRDDPSQPMEERAYRTAGTYKFNYTDAEKMEIRRKYNWSMLRGRHENTARVDRMLADIKDLDFAETIELVEGLQKMFEISDFENECIADAHRIVAHRKRGGKGTGMGGGGGGGGGGGDGDSMEGEAEPAEAKTHFDVKLTGFDAASKIKVIKEVRQATGLGLKESKALVEAGGVVKEALPKADAEALVKALSDVGATVELA